MKKGVTKSEYLKLLRRTETELRRELSKPAAQQDKLLIDECLESLSYYRKELEALRSERRTAASFSFARSFFTVVLALILTFAVGATVAEAAGFRVWTAIFKQDSGYLRVDYVPEITASPTERVEWQDAEMNFFEYEKYAEELEKNGFEPFPGEWHGYEFAEGGVRSTKQEYYSSLTMRGKEGYIRIRMIAKAFFDGPTSVWGLDESIPTVHVHVNGIDAAYQSDGHYAFATWQSGTRIYSVSVYDSVEDMEALLMDIVR